MCLIVLVVSLICHFSSQEQDEEHEGIREEIGTVCKALDICLIAGFSC